MKGVPAGPCWLYLFGKRGGPYKIGISCHPGMRASTLRGQWPGKGLAGSIGMFWAMVKFSSWYEAWEAERLIHSQYRSSRIYNNQFPTEWFDMMLPLTLEPLFSGDAWLRTQPLGVMIRDINQSIDQSSVF